MVKDKEFQAALHEFKKTQVLQEISNTFSQTVERCQVPVAAEVAPEMQLIRTAVALGLYVKRKAPELGGLMAQAMAGFLNTPRFGDFLAQQGGWRAVAGI
ncbi:hypothetical protein CRUP_010647 [Coryphaenoides rupestris]|nr:hypothetical protein CRUP_010647 [Coryphaenoides rupestris]